MANRIDLPWEVEGAVLAGPNTGEYLSDWLDSSGVFKVRVMVSGSTGASGNHGVSVSIQQSINAVDVIATSGSVESEITARYWRVRATGYPEDTFSGTARVLG